ncbi:MAG: Mth938-like domain-containing protein [Rhodobacterales bacterium]|nr:Mth938-like domain-containing protein [Rhodobacterales bacterium]
MEMHEINFENARPIDGYGPGFFRVGGQVFEGSLCVSPTSVASWGGFEDTKTLMGFAGKIDVLFVGTGAEIAHIPRDLRQMLEAAGIGVEVMNSPSACRTYNVLLSEGRRIAAALLAV